MISVLPVRLTPALTRHDTPLPRPPVLASARSLITFDSQIVYNTPRMGLQIRVTTQVHDISTGETHTSNTFHYTFACEVPAPARAPSQLGRPRWCLMSPSCVGCPTHPLTRARTFPPCSSTGPRRWCRRCRGRAWLYRRLTMTLCSSWRAGGGSSGLARLRKRTSHRSPPSFRVEQ